MVSKTRVFVALLCSERSLVRVQVGAITSQAAAERKLLIAATLRRLKEAREASHAAAAHETLIARQERQAALAHAEREDLLERKARQAVRAAQLRDQTEELATREAKAAVCAQLARLLAFVSSCILGIGGCKPG